MADSAVPPIRNFGWSILEHVRAAEDDGRRRGSAPAALAIPPFTPAAVKAAPDFPARAEHGDGADLSPGPATASLYNRLAVDSVETVWARLLMISPTLPRHDRTSSSLRVSHVIRMLAPYFGEIVFLYSSKTRDDLRYARQLPGNVSPKHVPLSSKAYAEAIEAARCDMLWATDLFDPRYIEQCVEAYRHARELDVRPIIVSDTMDCHVQKYARKASADSAPEQRDFAEKIFRLESALYALSDRLVVVTPNEAEAIRQHFPDAPPISVIPNVHRLADAVPDFSATDGLAFVGSAGVNHNRDAVLAFHAHVLPLLKAQTEDVRLDVIGSAWEPLREALSDPAVRLRGWIGDLDGTLARYRALICPLTYGTGLKGKLGSAASIGLPVVTTSVGAEGFPVRDGEHCYIADTAEAFADKTARLIADKPTWQNFQSRFYGLIAENYSPRAVSLQIRELMESLQT